VVREGPGSDRISLDDLRRAVREELAALPDRSASKSQAVAADSIAEPLESQAASTQAHAVLDLALARRSWTAADGDALREEFLAMSDVQRDEWLRKFSQAVNQGRLVPESERIPF
jgi:hypothetical protein